MTKTRGISTPSALRALLCMSLLVFAPLSANAAGYERDNPDVPTPATSAPGRVMRPLFQSSANNIQTVEAPAARIALSPRKAEPALPLVKPGSATHAGPNAHAFGPSLVSMIGSLLLVLGLFFVAMWILKRAMPQGSARLPSEVLQVLGQTKLTGRHQVHLIRVGQKLALLSVSASGVDTVMEIDDPAEVERLAGLCVQKQPQSATASFGQILSQLGPERKPRGFLDRAANKTKTAARTSSIDIESHDA